MTKKEYCDRLCYLLSAGLKAEKDGRIAEKCALFDEHDAMIENPQFYINE